MSDRTRTVLRALAGGYLAYVGFGLVKTMLKDQPDNMMMFVSVGLAFLAIGVALFGYSVSHYIKKDYIHQTDAKDETEETESTTEGEVNEKAEPDTECKVNEKRESTADDEEIDTEKSAESLD